MNDEGGAMDRYMLFPSGMGQHPNGSYALYADAQATIAALQAQHKLARDAWWESVKELEAQLTQRTAELEAEKAIQAIDLKNNNAYREQVANLHAELERVRGELVEAAHNTNVYQSLYSTGCMDRALLENDLRDIRTLIAALPKVEGQFEVGSGACYYVRALDGKSNPIICGLMTEQAVAYAILALLKHRQGME